MFENIAYLMSFRYNWTNILNSSIRLNENDREIHVFYLKLIFINFGISSSNLKIYAGEPNNEITKITCLKWKKRRNLYHCCSNYTILRIFGVLCPQLLKVWHFPLRHGRSLGNTLTIPIKLTLQEENSYNQTKNRLKDGHVKLRDGYVKLRDGTLNLEMGTLNLDMSR